MKNLQHRLQKARLEIYLNQVEARANAAFERFMDAHGSSADMKTWRKKPKTAIQ